MKRVVYTHGTIKPCICVTPIYIWALIIYMAYGGYNHRDVIYRWAYRHTHTRSVERYMHSHHCTWPEKRKLFSLFFIYEVHIRPLKLTIFECFSVVPHSSSDSIGGGVVNGERGTHSIGTTTSMTLGSVERGTHCTLYY